MDGCKQQAIIRYDDDQLKVYLLEDSIDQKNINNWPDPVLKVNLKI